MLNYVGRFLPGNLQLEGNRFLFRGSVRLGSGVQARVIQGTGERGILINKMEIGRFEEEVIGEVEFGSSISLVIGHGANLQHEAVLLWTIV